ncbi:Na+/H+ antiporter NhaC family protein [Shewanella youngdeokensis]|uniref:Na+/H+ antiporter NhaC family protein n=1 Tax=Shewanella youngdeokensis TaxID=2999068 RepID=A0ABZ0K306_9GAMM|nr:Na+/H+ antiporter NhaC family protein [Shewanella sp. DAU334]
MNTWISLLPPLLAIVLAITTRKAYLAILSGIVLGSILIAPTIPVGLMGSLNAISQTLQTSSALNSLIFILMVGAIIQLLQNSGAINNALQLITNNNWVKNRVQAQLITFAAGFLMCLEGIGSMMMVGVFGRPLFKRYHVSKQKLAFVANGTGAPLAWLLPFSSAGIFLTALIQVQVDQGLISGKAAQLVFASVPYQFYTLFILITVLLVAVTPFDFNKTTASTSNNKCSNSAIDVDSRSPYSLWVVMAPLYLLLLSMILIATVTGNGNPIDGDISSAIFYSGYVAVFGSVLIYTSHGLTLKPTLKWTLQGMLRILPAVMILTLAFSLSHVIGQLGTANYVAALMVDHAPQTLFPAIVFVVAIIISFATGSSGATVSILIPIALPMAEGMALPLPIVIGAGISGAVFGDQSSPISDSVIVAASAAGCTPDSHFSTQIPITFCIATLAFMSYLAVT